MPPKAAATERPNPGPTSNPRAGSSSQQAQSSASDLPQSELAGNSSNAKKRRRRANKKKSRRQSFAPPSEADDTPEPSAERPSLATVNEDTQHQSSFYRLGNRAGSDTSLESEALLDHREQNHGPSRPRRQSIVAGAPRQSQAQSMLAEQIRSSPSNGMTSRSGGIRSARHTEESDEEDGNDRTPLMKSSRRPSRGQSQGYGGLSSSYGGNRRQSTSSSVSNKKRRNHMPRTKSTQSLGYDDDYDVNNPPSVPGSPRIGGEHMGYDDVMLPEYSHSPDTNRRPLSRSGEAVIDIDRPSLPSHQSIPASPGGPRMGRRPTAGSSAEDVCLPFEQMTEIGEEEEDYMHQQDAERSSSHKRRHRKVWPDLDVLEDWSREEKEERTVEGMRAIRVDEPTIVGGRLRPQRGTWRREEEDVPFRWTYFNEELDSSLRSHSISGLQQLSNSFRELFIPDAPELEDSDTESEDEGGPFDRNSTPVNGRTSRAGTRQSSILDHKGFDSKQGSGERTPTKGADDSGKPKKYGPRPVFWLDVLQPTWEEMRVLSRAFGIHKLTAEDIMEQEAREKIELFRNYYFVNYRTFEQDEKSEDYLEPLNMYFVVFKGGVISFHFSQMPHPANVRRRIRQLAEHQYTDSDWIAYAIIDNITDAYAPLIEQIEEEVDDIDDEILMLHQHQAKHEVEEKKEAGPKALSDPQSSPVNKGGMLVRVGECRKRVMGLYRLLGNKADVIKGLAKRCNEQWQVAPRSDVGLYLGDIQDHIVTMTGNLTHYESILSRAHSNYLAQINIGMNERAEKTNDVLGKLTVLGTIVLPMNIVTGLWGMNCLVPGQVEDNPTLVWFFGLTGFLMGFGLLCFFIAKRVYGIV